MQHMSKTSHPLNKSIVLIALSLLFALPVFAQYKGRRKVRDFWRYYRHELTIGLGGSTFLGDLGGGAESGGVGITHIDIEATKFSATASYKYKLTPRINLRASLSYGTVSGADSLSENQGRFDRNLHFKSTLIEFSPLVEFFLIKESFPSRQRWGRWVQNTRPGNQFSIYIATGVSGFYYNPQAQFQGTWYDLRPLRTEGQGLDGRAEYGSLGFAIPIIGGGKFMFQQKWSIGAEVGVRLTNTDYMDDVSTDYYDNEALALVNGPLSAALADRHVQNDPKPVGDVRGNPDRNDTYIFWQVTLSRKIGLGK